MNTHASSEVGMAEMLLKLKESLKTLKEKMFMISMENGMKLCSFDTKKLKKKRSFGE